MTDSDVPADKRPALSSFWRDVLSQTVAGVLVAIVVYLGAIAFGYLTAPGVGELVLFIVALVVPGVGLGWLGDRRSKNKRTHWTVVALVILVAAAGMLYGAVMLASHPSDVLFPEG